MHNPIVIKIGGNEIDNPAFLAELPAVIRRLEAPAVIVHGGGKEIAQIQQQLGIEPRYVDGLRITDAPSLAVVEMVLCGLVNKRLVRYLLNGGVDALGISGADRGLVRAEKMQHPAIDMGYTGTITAVRAEVLHELLAGGVTPVIAPICVGSDSNYNLNADHVAGAVAAAINAQSVVFLTNVEGVLLNGTVMPTLTIQQAQALISDGTIFGGMIPKVQTALQALERGASQAVITNLQGLKAGGGTIFTASVAEMSS